MKTPKNLPKYISWIIKIILFITLFVLLFIFVDNKLNRFETIIFGSIILPNASLDFQNKSGAARIRSSFNDILIASEGSTKKGDGYEVKLKIINPSSIILRNIKCEFRYSRYNTPVICEDINMSIYPGNSKTLNCFISDLSDYDLKSINVSVQVDQISFY
jgi:hypothetical protein